MRRPTADRRSLSRKTATSMALQGFASSRAASAVSAARRDSCGPISPVRLSTGFAAGGSGSSSDVSAGCEGFGGLRASASSSRRPASWVAVPCCGVLCCAVLRCAVLCCAVLCCAVLCCAVLCCVLLVLCCVVLCCVVLCCVVLCCVVLCCVVLCCVVLCCFALCCVLRLLPCPPPPVAPPHPSALFIS